MPREGLAADSPDDPAVVEAFREVAQCLVGLLDGAEAPQPVEPSLRRADGALGAAVALADEGTCGHDIANPGGRRWVVEDGARATVAG